MTFRRPSPVLALVLFGALAVPLYIGVAWLSMAFAREDRADERPLLPILIALGAATVVHLLALAVVFRRRGEVEQDRSALRVVVGFALVYRLILLPSWPIQEIDFYRYLWDGRVTSHGFNPFHYSPSEVREPDDAADSEELRAIRRLAQESPSVTAIFQGVHHPEIPTAYPPVSQAVFAGVETVTPAAAPVWVHLLVLKIALLGFDIGTLFVLIGLLRRVELPAAWSLGYGWCPLALKEIANTAHHDPIAVFFTMAALYLLVRAGTLARRASEGGDVPRWRVVLTASAALAMLGLGMLAKTYPIMLVPVAAGYLFGLFGRWRPRALVPLATFALVVIVGYLPFHLPGRDATPRHHGGTGLSAFLLTHWEMNDLVFMVVRSNLARPASGMERWFVVVPVPWREALHDRVLDSWAEFSWLPEGADTAYLLTLAMLGSIVVAIALFQAIKLRMRPEPRLLLRGSFLVLAWGWLLASTQNPWYVLWCLPLMVFAGLRSWFLLPGLALLYYVRFWMASQASEDPSQAWAAFDYGVVWVEYVPLFVALLVEGWYRRGKACDAWG